MERELLLLSLLSGNTIISCTAIGNSSFESLLYGRSSRGTKKENTVPAFKKLLT